MLNPRASRLSLRQKDQVDSLVLRQTACHLEASGTTRGVSLRWVGLECLLNVFGSFAERAPLFLSFLLYGGDQCKI